MADRARSYCLDSWAVLRFLEGSSPAARRVRQVLRRGRPIMSWINLGEVYYTIHRAAGGKEADATLAMLRPILALDAVTPERVLAAARIKATHPLAYADAFAIATAAAHRAVLLTGDPEISFSGGKLRIFRKRPRWTTRRASGRIASSSKPP